MSLKCIGRTKYEFCINSRSETALYSKQPVEQHNQQKERIAKHVKYFKRISQELRQKLMSFAKCSIRNTLFPFCKDIKDIVIVDKDTCREFRFVSINPADTSGKSISGNQQCGMRFDNREENVRFHILAVKAVKAPNNTDARERYVYIALRIE